MFASYKQLSVLDRTNLAGLSILVTGVSVLLWPQWSENPDLSHGMLMPVLFLFLLYESRTAGPRSYIKTGRITAFAQIACILLGITSLIFTGLFAAAVDWSHALVALPLGFALVFLLLASLSVYANESVRLIPLNWTTLVAIALWLLCVPIPPGAYNRLTLTLQFFVTEQVLDTLHWLGIAALRQGNIIELARTSVGVEEACSGIRSLISCVFAGFFFSATFVRKTWARALIILLAAPLAILMNFIRSLTLTLLANQQIDIDGFWHDFTGYGVLGVTAGLLFLLAVLLAKKDDLPRSGAQPATRPRTRFPQIALAGGLVVAASATLCFAVSSLKPAAPDQAAPDLASLLPEQFDGWRVQTDADLYRFSDILNTRHLIQRTYVRQEGQAMRVIIVYFAYWSAGQAPVSLVAMHTPDACWPGSGWVQVPVINPRPTLSAGSHTLPVAESRHFRSHDFPQYVWFWHMYAGRAINHIDPYSPRQLLRIAWKYGFSQKGDQFFVRVSSNLTWDKISDEALLKEIFHRLEPRGF